MLRWWCYADDGVEPNVTLAYRPVTSWFIMHVHIERTNSSKSWKDMPEKHCGFTQEQSILAGEWWKIVCRINCQRAKTTSPSWMTWFGPMSALGSGDGKAMFMVKPSWKNWILLGADVTSPAKCAAAVASQPTPYETGHFFKCQICKLCRKTQVKL